MHDLDVIAAVQLLPGQAVTECQSLHLSASFDDYSVWFNASLRSSPTLSVHCMFNVEHFKIYLLDYCFCKKLVCYCWPRSKKIFFFVLIAVSISVWIACVLTRLHARVGRMSL
jgi:hypothetical protein